MLQEAYAVALQKWPAAGTPANPRAWLISTARHKAIDRMRRDQRFERKSEEIAKTAKSPRGRKAIGRGMFADDRLRLIFTCCHPSLPLKQELRSLFEPFAESPPKKFRGRSWFPWRRWRSGWYARREKFASGIPYRVPSRKSCETAWNGVLLVVYLIFNEGYLASSGDALIRQELCAEAIRLGRVLCGLLPKQAEAQHF